MTTNHSLIRRWRIVEADLWKRNYLDLVDPRLLDDGPSIEFDYHLGDEAVLKAQRQASSTACKRT